MNRAETIRQYGDWLAQITGSLERGDYGAAAVLLYDIPDDQARDFMMFQAVYIKAARELAVEISGRAALASLN
jgi:hypothetical protein